MSRAKIEYDDYKVKAFLDTNIILEGRPLPDLPWHEIDADGPIIALITSTTMKEVDSKKQDGRIGKRAREFNRLIAPVAAGGAPIGIRDSKPRVELALSHATRIPWNQLDDLDPTDGDSCIVAEALHAKEMNSIGKLIVSHDIKPIALASIYDLEVLHVSDNWLLPPLPSPHDKEMQRLKAKVANYEVKEPAFEIAFDLIDPEPVPVVRIEDLTDIERARIEERIVADHPPVSQSRGIYDLASAVGFDHSYDDRYKAYRERIPIFMENYAQRLERLFNQARCSIRVENVGKLQAENLLVEVSVSGGWLHDRFVWASPYGPACPIPRIGPPHGYLLDQLVSSVPQLVGRHEFAFKDEPVAGASFSVTCEDFRHEEKWEYEAIVGIDPRVPETEVTITATAANFSGKESRARIVQRSLETLHVSKVVDLDSFKIKRPTPIHGLINRKGPGDRIDRSAFAVHGDNE